MRDMNVKPIEAKSTEAKSIGTPSTSNTKTPGIYDPSKKYETLEDYLELYKNPPVVNFPDPPPGVPVIQRHDSGFPFRDEASKKLAEQNFSYGINGGLPAYHIRGMASDPRVSPEFKDKFFRENPHLDPRNNPF